MQSKRFISFFIFFAIIILIISFFYSIPLSSAKNDKIKRIDIVHYADPRMNGVGNFVRSSDCYSLLGIKPIIPINYTINPENNQGIDKNFVVNAIRSSANTWDKAVGKKLFGNYEINYNVSNPWFDGKNSVVFSDIFLDTSLIGQISSFIDTDTGSIIEFDMILNSKLPFGDATLNFSLMDIQNAITHEFGHGLGLGDVYDSQCSYVTMFGYGSFGETMKRTLEKPDVRGLKSIY